VDPGKGRLGILSEASMQLPVQGYQADAHAIKLVSDLAVQFPKPGLDVPVSMRLFHWRRCPLAMQQLRAKDLYLGWRFYPQPNTARLNRHYLDGGTEIREHDFFVQSAGNYEHVRASFPDEARKICGEVRPLVKVVRECDGDLASLPRIDLR
jgi:hypothetical protein